MNEMLKTIGMEFHQLIVLIIVIVGSVIAIKLTITFDINKYLENRQQARYQKIKNSCPHFAMIPLNNNKVEIRSLFVSPPGTVQHQCRKCGLVTYLDIQQHERQADYYLNNLDEYTKANKKFNKLLKKSGQA